MRKQAWLLLVLISLLATGPVFSARAGTVVPVGTAVFTGTTDTLVEVVTGLPVTLDPAYDYETQGAHVIQQVYEGLVAPRRDAMNEFVPQLATSWLISPDGRTYTFALRRGVIFHNNAPLTPADVAYSFRRGLLQGSTYSPQWLLAEPLLGPTANNDITDQVDPTGALVNDPTALKSAAPAKLLAACQKVLDAVTYDNTAWTVTFHLAQPWDPFIATLSGSWGSVLNQAWTVAQGGWDGSCATWQNYYDPSLNQLNQTALGSGENGTGPLMLDHYTNSEIGLKRFNAYWRSEPAWAGGPTGPAAFQTVLIQTVLDENTRVSMLKNGQADTGSFSLSGAAQLSSSVMLAYNAGQPDPLLVNPGGTLKRYSNRLVPQAQAALFNYNINATGPNNYIGSAALDGSGIPPNFFTDVHVRKAFNYAFDWNSLIQTLYGGAARQTRGPIIAGLTGYSDSQPVYSYDAAQALAEFNLAWSGEVASKGFTFTVAYNAGNNLRKTALQILKANVEALNPLFHINVVEVADFAVYSNDLYAGSLPIFIVGWMQDIPHPHNWVGPFMRRGGIFVNQQRMTADLLDLFTPKVDQCAQSNGPDAQLCYEELQAMAHDYAIDIFLIQGMQDDYTRAEVQNYYINSSVGLPYFYALSKTVPPVTEVVPTTGETVVTATEANGSSEAVTIPVGSFSEPVRLVVSPGGVNGGESPDFTLGRQGFDISAFVDASGEQLHPTFDPLNPVMITINYNPASLGAVNEATLKLYYLNPATGIWEDGACGTAVLDTTAHTYTAPVCHFSQFALGGVGYHMFMPVARR